MTGLGLDGFLGHGQDRGGGKRKFLNDWKKKGSIVVWLSTRYHDVAEVSWNHPFNMNATFKDKQTGEESEYLKFSRFASPDPEIVHKSQFFTEPDGRLQVPPRLDPFLRLREWLKRQDSMPLTQVVFEWRDHKNREDIRWTRGELARLVDRGKKSWNHSLDTKLEYLFVVIDDANPGEGPQIVRVSRSLGEKMQKEIRKQMDSEDDAGNPLKNPYAFKWTYDKDARSFNDQYDAARYGKAKLTDEIRAAITATDYPDPAVDASPRPGDKARIRAAMEDAAKIDLPWDELFVPEWKDDASPDRPARTAEFSDAEEPDTNFEFGANVKQNDNPAADTRGEPKTRQRKAADKPPEPKRIPCDDCGHPMLPTESKCEKCGTEYEVNEDAPAPAPAPATKPKPAPAVMKPAPTTKGDAALSKCFACGGIVQDDVCQNCGLEVVDDTQDPY